MALDELTSQDYSPDFSGIMSQPIDVSAPEFEVRKTGWQKILDNLHDPNVQQALVQTGLGLMKTPQAGQNNYDVIANGIQAGVGTLQALRERDRQQKLQDEEKARLLAQQGFENTLKTNQDKRQNTTTQAYVDQVAAQTANAKDAKTFKERELALEERYKTGMLNVAERNASSNFIKAEKTGSGGGAASVEREKLDALTNQYKAEGLDDTAARAKAVLTLKAGSGGKTPQEQARLIYLEKIKAYQNSIEGMQNPLTPEMSQQLLESSMQDAQKLSSIGGQPANPPGVGTSGQIERADPDIQAEVTRMLGEGKSKEQIKVMLQKFGRTPSVYGIN